MSKNIILLDHTKDELLPRTSATRVYLNDSTTVAAELERVDSRFTAISGGLVTSGNVSLGDGAITVSNIFGTREIRITAAGAPLELYGASLHFNDDALITQSALDSFASGVQSQLADYVPWSAGKVIDNVSSINFYNGLTSQGSILAHNGGLTFSAANVNVPGTLNCLGAVGMQANVYVYSRFRFYNGAASNGEMQATASALQVNAPNMFVFQTPDLRTGATCNSISLYARSGTVVSGSGPVTLTNASGGYLAIGNGNMNVYASTGVRIFNPANQLRVEGGAVTLVNSIDGTSATLTVSAGKLYVNGTLIG